MMNAENNFPTYTILAGSNGAGKSTLRSFMNLTDKVIDPDLIARVNKMNEFEEIATHSREFIHELVATKR